ncbi:MAG: MotA/TolQ/ExbB proton channel family protein [Pseudomonadota bacterium]
MTGARRALSGLVLALFLGLPGAGPAAIAQQPGETTRPFEDLLEKLETRRARLKEEGAAQVQRFRQQADERRSLLAAADAELAAARDAGGDLEARLADLDREVASLAETYDTQIAPYRPFIRSFADETAAIRAAAIRYGDRPVPLLPQGERQRLPDRPSVEAFRRQAIQLMANQSFVRIRTLPAIGDAGGIAERRLVLAGPFAAVGEAGLQRFEGETGRYRLVGGALPRRLASATSRFSGLEAQAGLLPVPLDVSGVGAALQLYEDRPGALSRLSEGRFVGFLILLLMAVGIAIACERIIRLEIWAMRMRKEKRGDEPVGDNPYRPVLTAWEAAGEAPAAVLESRLQEAILQAAPPVERRIGVLKVLAGLATLLGLLGTVIGMVRTFEVFAVFGGGAPQLMAAGISEALITTMLGLIAAIPLIVLHAIAQARSEAVIAMLEEEAAGLVAQRMEEAARTPQTPVKSPPPDDPSLGIPDIAAPEPGAIV